ncbi:MAG: hypothetical protein HY847_10985 [Betaproteobacteria bacterium]|nr:hypothetical protein [Betaproteobacteria bacterium]
MAAIELLRSQKNQAYAAIVDAGLEPSDFRWARTNGSLRLTHRPTNFYFVFGAENGFHGQRWVISFFPAQSLAKEVFAGYFSEWEKTLRTFKTWVSIIAREHSEPDYWAISQQEKNLIAERIDDLENLPFSSTEILRISSAIRELKEHLLANGTQSAKQIEFISTRLQHLEDSSHRLGRKDWITLAMGTLTNIAVGVALAPETARDLLRTAGALLGWVVGNVHLLP